MRKKLVKNTESSNLNSAIVKPKCTEVLFEDEHLKGEKHFKLRAECLHDVHLLIKKMPMNLWGIKIVQWGPMPDVEFEFKSRFTLDEIMAILRRQVDSHVMMDTLKPFDEYTGER